MILSRAVWADATGRYAENPFNPRPTCAYLVNGQGQGCIAVTGTQDQYLDFINCLAWVQYGSRPAQALREVRFLAERTAVLEGDIEAEVVTWYLPSVRVAPEVSQ